VVIQFSHDFMGAPFFNAPEMAPIRRLLTESHRGLIFKGTTQRNALRLTETLLKLKGTPRVMMLIELLNCLATAKAPFNRLSSCPFDETPSTKEQALFDRAFATIVGQYRHPLRQAEVAKSLHMTPKTFNRYSSNIAGTGLPNP